MRYVGCLCEYIRVIFCTTGDVYADYLTDIYNILGTKHAAFQVEYLGTKLKGDALEWYTRNVKRHDRPIKNWSLESVFKGLQKWFLNTLTHRQVSSKFNTIEQGRKILQELIHELTKYAGQMVQYPDDYSFKRRLLSTLRPSLQKEVLCRGITTEFISIQVILEKSKDLEDSSWYDISWEYYRKSLYCTKVHINLHQGHLSRCPTIAINPADL